MDPECQFVVTEDRATDDRSVTTQPENGALSASASQVSAPEVLDAGATAGDAVDDADVTTQPENGALSASASQVSAPEVLNAGATAGAGVASVEAAGATGDAVINSSAPGSNAMSACELTCRLAFALAVPAQLKNAGRRERPQYSGTELDGKAILVIGLGRAGREVAVLMDALGMKVFCYDPYAPVDAYEDYGVHMELSEIWPIVDYITLHMPLVEGTRNFIDASVINQCKKGVKIINVSDGGLINMCDLMDALQSGQVDAAGLQGSEPNTREILKYPNVSVVPIIGPPRTEAQVGFEEEISTTDESD